MGQLLNAATLINIKIAQINLRSGSIAHCGNAKPLRFYSENSSKRSLDKRYKLNENTTRRL